MKNSNESATVIYLKISHSFIEKARSNWALAQFVPVVDYHNKLELCPIE